MQIPKKNTPTLEDLKARNVPNPEKILEIQQMAQEIYSIGLENNDSLWFGNTYGLKPNSYLEGMKSYGDAVMKQGEKAIPYWLGGLKESLQDYFAELIGCTNSQRIALGINATTFMCQILSNYWGKSFKILTTNLEFYGVAKVLNRLKEIEGVQVDHLDANEENFETFGQRLEEACLKTKYDLFIMSDVFFKSGNILENIAELLSSLKPNIGKIVIDGSSCFGNLPVKEIWGPFINEIYYIAAPKKFLGCGEGLVFMSVPEKCEDRPIFTGWLTKDFHNEKNFYEFPIEYPKNSGDIYCNSTQDFGARERALAVLDHYKKVGFSFEKQYFYNATLQEYFIKKLEENNISFMGKHNLINRMGKYRPLQTCFRLNELKITAKEVCKKLESRNIRLTARGNVLRICMAVFYTVFELERVIKELVAIDEEIKQK